MLRTPKGSFDPLAKLADVNVIDVYVRYLRDKVDRPFGLHTIETVRGAGYRLRSDGGARNTHLPR
jgi:DNA-binding response OmpR family regulator